jgi:hypothetical protein
VHHDDVRCSELTGSLFCAQRAQFFILRATRPVLCFARNAPSSLFCAQRAQFFVLRATRAGCTARKIEKGSFDVRAVYISIFANNAVAIWWVWRVEKNPNIKDVF